MTLWPQPWMVDQTEYKMTLSLYLVLKHVQLVCMHGKNTYTLHFYDFLPLKVKRTFLNCLIQWPLYSKRSITFIQLATFRLFNKYMGQLCVAHLYITSDWHDLNTSVCMYISFWQSDICLLLNLPSFSLPRQFTICY